MWLEKEEVGENRRPYYAAAIAHFRGRAPPMGVVLPRVGGRVKFETNLFVLAALR